MKPERPKEIPGVHKSSIVKFQTKEYYIPSMKGYNYAPTVAQLEDRGALHPDAHMFFIKMKEEHPDIITAIMTQLLLVGGLEQWGNKYHNYVHSEMKHIFLETHSNQCNVKNCKIIKVRVY